jgi:hypothetical protein
MSDAEDQMLTGPDHRAGRSVAVIVPLFPRSPGLRASLASLNEQTLPPDLVVFLDDGTTGGAEEMRGQIPNLPAEVVPTEPCALPAALNAATKHLARFDFIAFLQGGDFYAPARLEQCLAAMLSSAGTRLPAMVVTGLRAVDSRGTPLAEDDPRARHLDMLWAPGRAGSGLPEWLGSGYFPATLSNVFARREYLEAAPFSEEAAHFDQVAVILAALQSRLAVVHEPLLDHYPPALGRGPTPRQTADSLTAQWELLSALRGKLPVSPETRRNTAVYHRAAWNSLSGVREDLFQQLVMQLAASVAPDEARSAIAAILRSHEAQSPPTHWQALLEGKDPLDLAAYADALQRNREELREAREENERLGAIAEAAQQSGWVRFGAWAGDRGARRIMELEEKTAPDGDEGKTD